MTGYVIDGDPHVDSRATSRSRRSSAPPPNQHVGVLGECGVVVEDPELDRTLTGLVVPEVLLTDGDPAGDDEYLAEAGLRYEQMIDRILRGLPVVRGGRTVAALQELPGD